MGGLWETEEAAVVESLEGLMLVSSLVVATVESSLERRCLIW